MEDLGGPVADDDHLLQLHRQRAARLAEVALDGHELVRCEHAVGVAVLRLDVRKATSVGPAYTRPVPPTIPTVTGGIALPILAVFYRGRGPRSTERVATIAPFAWGSMAEDGLDALDSR